MEDEASGDHEGEDDIKANGDGEVRKTKVHGDSVPQTRARLGREVEGNDAHRLRERDLGTRMHASAEMYLQIEAK